MHISRLDKSLKKKKKKSIDLIFESVFALGGVHKAVS